MNCQDTCTVAHCRYYNVWSLTCVCDSSCRRAFFWQRKRTVGICAVGMRGRGSWAVTWMCPLKRQLLVMIQTIRKESVIRGHGYLHRLNETFKLLNALKYILHTGQVPAKGLPLPGV